MAVIERTRKYLVESCLSGRIKIYLFKFVVLIDILSSGVILWVNSARATWLSLKVAAQI